MQIRVLTVRFDPVRGEFDDAELRQFQQTHRVTAVREHFFTDGQRPGLAVVVEFTAATEPAYSSSSAAPLSSSLPLGVSSASSSSVGGTKSRPAYPTAEELRARLATDEQRQIFDALRKWRRGTATDEAVPPYVVLSNQQVMDLATLMPRTKAGVLKVAGIGKKKADRYAPAILAEISAIAGTPETELDPGSGESGTDATDAEPDCASERAVGESTEVPA